MCVSLAFLFVNIRYVTENNACLARTCLIETEVRRKNDSFCPINSFIARFISHTISGRQANQSLKFLVYTCIDWYSVFALNLNASGNRRLTHVKGESA